MRWLAAPAVVVAPSGEPLVTPPPVEEVSEFAGIDNLIVMVKDYDKVKDNLVSAILIEKAKWDNRPEAICKYRTSELNSARYRISGFGRDVAHALEHLHNAKSP